jgi:hypothetical protein
MKDILGRPVDESYSPKIGDVWRHTGPRNAVVVDWICWPGQPGYDGGLPGISVTHLTPNGRKNRRMGSFYPCLTGAGFALRMGNEGKHLANKEATR